MSNDVVKSIPPRAGTEAKSNCFRAGEYEVNLASRRVTRGRSEVVVSPTSFDVLALLLCRSPEAVSVAELLDTVWAGKVVTRDTVKQRVKVLREELPSTVRDGLIQNVRGYGYRMVAVEREAGPPATRRRWLALAGTALVLFGAGAYMISRPPPLTLPLVIGVLPFDDLAGENPMLAARLQDRLTTEIAGSTANSDVRVLATSMVRFASDAGWEPRRYGEELDADFLFEGALGRNDRGYELRVRFVYIATATAAWQRSYDLHDPNDPTSLRRISSDLAAFVRRKVDWIRRRTQH